MSDLRISTRSTGVLGTDAPPEPSVEAPVLVVGLGEVGGPLLEVLRRGHPAAGRDIEERAFHGVQILHLCVPFGPEFLSVAVDYAELYQPEVLVVNSTVVPGTTRAIQEKTGIAAVYSPLRGKHARMAIPVFSWIARVVPGTTV